MLDEQGHEKLSYLIHLQGRLCSEQLYKVLLNHSGWGKKKKQVLHVLPCSLLLTFTPTLTYEQAGPFNGAQTAEDPFTMVNCKSESFNCNVNELWIITWQLWQINLKSSCGSIDILNLQNTTRLPLRWGHNTTNSNLSRFLYDDVGSLWHREGQKWSLGGSQNKVSVSLDDRVQVLPLWLAAVVHRYLIRWHQMPLRREIQK